MPLPETVYPDRWIEHGETVPSFATYLRDHARRTDDPAGDFVEDARDEILKDRFTDAKSWTGVEQYLWLRGACNEAVEAGYECYRRYWAWLRTPFR